MDRGIAIHIRAIANVLQRISPRLKVDQILMTKILAKLCSILHLQGTRAVGVRAPVANFQCASFQGVPAGSHVGVPHLISGNRTVFTQKRFGGQVANQPVAGGGADAKTRASPQSPCLN